MLPDEKFFSSLARILKDMGKEIYLKPLELERQAFFSPEIRIGMWGQFSCGKSSLINALIGKEFLPANIAETTATVTEIRYGETEEIILNPSTVNRTFPYSKALALLLLTGKTDFESINEGMKEGISSAEFENAKKSISVLKETVDKVVLKIPCELLKTGIILVDLPGLQGSRNKEILAKERVQDCEIILWLKAPDRPVDENDDVVISMLKPEQSKSILFAIKTKSDSLFRDYYASGESPIPEKELYQKFKSEFKGEIQKFNFDEIFLVSPLIFGALENCNQDSSATLAVLKKRFPNKFRFLKDSSDLGIISGHNYFKKDFFGTINAKRQEAKLRKVQGSISLLISKIGQEIAEYQQSLESSKKMDLEEYNLHGSELGKINNKLLKLKDVRTKLNQSLESDFNRFINENYQSWIKIALSNCSQNENSYRDVEHVIESISNELNKVILLKLKDETIKQKIDGIISTSLDSFKRDFIQLENDINKFSQSLFADSQGHENLSHLLGATNEISNSAKLKYSDGLIKDGFAGGAGAIAGVLTSVAFDSTMEILAEGALGIFGGFGIFTAIRGAYHGNKNGDGIGIGIQNSFLNMKDGALALFGKAMDKDMERKANIRVILRRMASPGEREGFSGDIFAQTYMSFGSTLKNNILDEITTKIQKQKIIELMEVRYQSQHENLNNVFEAKSLNLSQKSEALKKLEQCRHDYMKLLKDYSLLDRNATKKEYVYE